MQQPGQYTESRPTAHGVVWVLLQVAEDEGVDRIHAAEGGRLLQIAELAIADADGTVRVGGAEILGRLVQERMSAEPADAARVLLQGLQGDSDHRVVAAALNGLQTMRP